MTRKRSPLPVQVLADGRCAAWYKERMILVLKTHGLFGFDVFHGNLTLWDPLGKGEATCHSSLVV